MLKANWFGFLFLMFSLCAAQEEYARLSEIVVDDAQIFTQAQLDGLRDKLYRFESETSNQLVVLTIDKLRGETIEQYALEVHEYCSSNASYVSSDHVLCRGWRGTVCP